MKVEELTQAVFGVGTIQGAAERAHSPVKAEKVLCVSSASQKPAAPIYSELGVCGI